PRASAAPAASLSPFRRRAHRDGARGALRRVPVAAFPVPPTHEERRAGRRAERRKVRPLLDPGPEGPQADPGASPDLPPLKKHPDPKELIMTPVYIDVREKDEFDAEHLEDSIHLPLSCFARQAPAFLRTLQGRP